MSDNPRLLVHGVSTDDVKQGTLGDCWFLSACASIARESQLMAKVIPKDQYLWRGEGRYAGVAHFRFWRFGDWEDVYVDDKLPTRWSNLTYARCSDKNEFWLPLIEKAYAKLNGSYSSLDRGQTTVALTDLTGGICERFKTGFQEAAVLYQAMLKAQKRGSFMTCSTHSTFEEGHDSGLVSGHAYTITGVSKIRSSGKTHRLIKIRNPWGRQEWKGAWSDGMEYDDWSEFYREVTIASLAEHETVRTGPKSKWDVAQEIGEWVRGETAGGSVGYQKTYWKNPQYLFTLSSEDDFDPEEDDEEDRGTCSVLIGLMQENKQFKGKFTHIGFQVYEVSSPDRELKLSKRQLGQSSPVFRTLSYYNTREVTLRIQMDPGTYVIVPTTHEPKIEGPFLLRVFTEKPTQLRELGKEQERAMERVQRRALRIISRSGRRDVPELPTLQSRREDAAVKLFRQMLQENHPLHDLVPVSRANATGRSLRNKNTISIPPARTKRLQNSFLHQSIRLYNQTANINVAALLPGAAPPRARSPQPGRTAQAPRPQPDAKFESKKNLEVQRTRVSSDKRDTGCVRCTEFADDDVFSKYLVTLVT
ncbi:hypothetical protein Bbelb_039900 [Branchiostoma belcheri]|nr:hypothetical protein Bbelb_039900 [Branchiostoma belcheri]